jgi:D-alanine-D-alanine ligase
VLRFNADAALPARLTRAPFDIAFNIATGIHGGTRPANVPAMLDYLRIPHTGPGVFAETVTHHKPVMKALLLAAGLPTPRFQVFHHPHESLKPSLRFPLIAKLPAEGGSLGLDDGSVVHGEGELRARVALLLEKYRQGVLVEEYIDGREFTVPVLGNHPPYALPVVERMFLGDCHIILDAPELATLRELERLTGQTYSYPADHSISAAPADVPEVLTARIQQAAASAYRRLECQDWARVDLRMDPDANIYIIDVNLEPAIAPDYALAVSARAAGWSYTELVNRILGHALERYPHLRQHASATAPRAAGVQDGEEDLQRVGKVR